MDNIASMPSKANAPINQREGRHSSLHSSVLAGWRQLTDPLDE